MIEPFAPPRRSPKKKRGNWSRAEHRPAKRKPLRNCDICPTALQPRSALRLPRAEQLEGALRAEQLLRALRLARAERAPGRRELANEYLLAKIGVDTAENEPCKDCVKIARFAKNAKC